jgi:Ni,Fe-hydrogenase maturation factor
MMTRALILGYGNPLRGDDALGLLAAEKFSPATN